MPYQHLFETLWNDYTKSNPHALKVYELFCQRGEKVINDHIALRTFNDPRVNIAALEKFFIAYGYKECGFYEFPIKKLLAKHYEHADPEAPKVFISELLLQEFSPFLQETIQECVNKIPKEMLPQEKLLYSGTTWKPLSYSIYQKLLKESEYAAWMYVFGYCANHFTVNVNALQTFSDLNSINQFITQKGFTLNNSGGLIKGTPQEYLEQSSTLAGEVNVSFIEGVYKIPSCYYEFAKRYPLPNGKLYTGFIAASADKIFESTDSKLS